MPNKSCNIINGRASKDGISLTIPSAIARYLTQNKKIGNKGRFYCTMVNGVLQISASRPMAVIPALIGNEFISH